MPICCLTGNSTRNKTACFASSKAATRLLSSFTQHSITSTSYPNICTPQSIKRAQGVSQGAQLAESRMFGRKQNQGRAQGSWISLDDLELFASANLPPRRTQNRASKAKNSKLELADCCQCTIICFFGTCSSTYELSLQAPVGNG